MLGLAASKWRITRRSAALLRLYLLNASQGLHYHGG
jgi:hypothetical protein